MTERKKFGWTEKGILSACFLPLGAIMGLVAVSVLLWGNDLDEDARLALLLTFGISAALFLVAGGILLALDLLRRSRARSAWEGGYSVMATIAGCQVNGRVNVHTGHPVVVECHWRDPATDVVHVYYSRYLYIRVDDLLTGTEVPVYLDRMDPDRYFVDIDAVLPRTKVHR